MSPLPPRRLPACRVLWALLLLPLAGPAQALTLVGDTLVIDTTFVDSIDATDSTIDVVAGGSFGVNMSGMGSVNPIVELFGDSEFRYASPLTSSTVIFTARGSSRIDLESGSIQDSGPANPGIGLFDDAVANISGTTLSNPGITIDDLAVLTMSDGGLFFGGGGGLTVAPGARFEMSGGTLQSAFAAGLGAGGGTIDISGGDVLIPGPISWQAGTARISGGTHDAAEWIVGGGILEVRGALALTSGRIVGTLADGSALDVAVSGQLANLRLVAPEAGTNALLMGWLLVSVRRARRRRR